MEALETTAERSVVTLEEAGRGTSQGMRTRRNATPTRNGSENLTVCAISEKPQALDSMGFTPTPQDMKSNGRLSEAAQQFSCLELNVARSFLLPLKRNLYRYICSLRALLSCPLETLSRFYPPLRLLQSEKEQLQVFSLAQTALPRRLYRVSAESVHEDCTPSNLSSTNISHISLEDSGISSDNSIFTPSCSGPAAAPVTGDTPQATRPHVTVATWKPFSMHITNILEAESFDELLPYIEIFDPCLQAATTPAALTPQACALLCAGLRHVEESGYSVSAFRRQKRAAAEDVTLLHAVACKRGRAVCASASCEAAPLSIVPYSALDLSSGSTYIVCNEDQLDKGSMLHGENEGGRPLHTAPGEQQATVSRHVRRLPTCEGGQIGAVPEPGCSTLTDAGAGRPPPSPLLRTSKSKGSSLSAADSCCGVAVSPLPETRHLHSEVAFNTPSITCKQPAQCSSCPKTAGPGGHNSQGNNRNMEVAKADYDLSPPADSGACSMVPRSCEFLSKEALNEKQQAYRTCLEREQESAAVFNPLINTYTRDARHCSGEEQLSDSSAFFRVDNAVVDDPQFEKALERAKRICLQHLHWLRRLVPAWSGKAYKEHTAAILRAYALSDLTNYLIVFANLKPGVKNKSPVNGASLVECLKELEIMQHVYTSSTSPKGLLHSCTRTAHASVRANLPCSSGATFPDSRESISATFPPASLAPVASQTDSIDTSTSVPSTEHNYWGCACAPNMLCDSPSLLVSEEKGASGLPIHLRRHSGTAGTSSHCRSIAAAAPDIMQQSGLIHTLRAHIPRTNCWCSTRQPAASHVFEPALPVGHTHRNSSDCSSWLLYESEVQACLKRVVVEGDSWLLQSKHASRSAEEHGSCFTFNKSCRSTHNSTRQERNKFNLEKQQGGTSIETVQFRCPGDRADSPTFIEKSWAESCDGNATCAKKGASRMAYCKSGVEEGAAAAANGDSFANDADLGTMSPSEKDTQRGEKGFLEGNTYEPRNDYVAELLLLLEDSQLPCFLQEELYAEVSQYVSAPAISPAQWRQVVWREAQQRQEEQQVLLQPEHHQQVEEKQRPIYQQRHLVGPVAKEYATGKQCPDQQSVLLDRRFGGKENTATRGGTRLEFARQTRRRRKCKRISGRSSSAGKELSAGKSRCWRAVDKKNRVPTNFRRDFEKNKSSC